MVQLPSHRGWTFISSARALGSEKSSSDHLNQSHGAPKVHKRFIQKNNDMKNVPQNVKPIECRARANSALFIWKMTLKSTPNMACYPFKLYRGHFLPMFRFLIARINDMSFDFSLPQLPIPTHRSYIPSQMALLGFFCDSTLLASNVTSIHARACDKERDRDSNPHTLSPELSALTTRPPRPTHKSFD